MRSVKRGWPESGSPLRRQPLNYPGQTLNEISRLQAPISALGTIARPAALERIPAPSGQFGLVDYSDVAAERNGSELADAEAPKTSGGGSIEGGTSMTQNPFATAQQMSPRPQERAG